MASTQSQQMPVGVLVLCNAAGVKEEWMKLSEWNESHWGFLILLFLLALSSLLAVTIGGRG